MSLDNRFSKTNYLKTNLLKQIKNILGLSQLNYLHCKYSLFWINKQEIF